MSPLGWVGLLIVAAILVLPGAGAARAGTLVVGGRLGSGSTDSRRARSSRSFWRSRRAGSRRSRGSLSRGPRRPSAAQGLGQGLDQGLDRGRADRSAAASPGRWLPLIGLGAGMSTAAGCGVLFGVSGAVLLGVAAAAVFATGGLLARDVLRAREAVAGHRELRAAVAVLIGELDAGAQPAVALGAAAGAGPRVSVAFTRAATAARTSADAGAELADSGHRDLRLLGIAWGLGEETGAPLAGVLGQVARDLQAADDQRRTVSVALAGPRSSAGLLCGLPILGIGLGAAMGARPLPLLIESPAGRALCCAGLLLDMAGLLWIRLILRRAVTS